MKTDDPCKSLPFGIATHFPRTAKIGRKHQKRDQSRLHRRGFARMRHRRDKMSARCAALSVASGDKKYIDGACVLTDSDGDQIFSTFDTRDTDKSQPEMNCGTHIITGGTGKYKGITGSEPFACITMPALAGPGGYTAMDIPHNTTWEIK